MKEIYIRNGLYNLITIGSHEQAMKGPKARARAPKERKIPMTLPFSSPSPKRNGNKCQN